MRILAESPGKPNPRLYLKSYFGVNKCPAIFYLYLMPRKKSYEQGKEQKGRNNPFEHERRIRTRR